MLKGFNLKLRHQQQLMCAPFEGATLCQCTHPQFNGGEVKIGYWHWLMGTALVTTSSEVERVRFEAASPAAAHLRFL